MLELGAGCLMNVGKILCNIYLCFFISPQGSHGKESLKCYLTLNLLFHKKGTVFDRKNRFFILCDNYFLAIRLCMGKVYLKIRYHKRRLGLKKDCVMYMRDFLATS